MNIITEAIVTALHRSRDERSIEAYERLRETLLAEFGPNTDLMNQLESLESNPDDEKLQLVLDDALHKAKADDNEMIVEVAKMTLSILEELGLEFSGTGTVRTSQYLKYEDAEDDW